MKRNLALAARVLSAVLVLCPWAAQAQFFGNYYYPSYGPQFLLGASIGASIWPDEVGSTAGWLNGAYASAASSTPANPLVTFGRQDQTEFGAKAYGDAWITPNVGLEAGFTWLGRIGWRAYSTNATGSFAVDSSGTVMPHAWYEAVQLGLDSYGVRYFIKGGAYEASTELGGNNYNFNTGAGSGASATVHNTGGLVGVGFFTEYGHTSLRFEVEDYINLGTSSSPAAQIPPWRGSVVLISAGVAYLF